MSFDLPNGLSPQSVEGGGRIKEIVADQRRAFFHLKGGSAQLGKGTDGILLRHLFFEGGLRCGAQNIGFEILAGHGQMYVADERFKTNIDKNGNGTAEFASRAIEAYVKG